MASSRETPFLSVPSMYDFPSSTACAIEAKLEIRAREEKRVEVQDLCVEESRAMVIWQAIL